jgi:hypothetical protein
MQDRWPVILMGESTGRSGKDRSKARVKGNRPMARIQAGKYAGSVPEKVVQVIEK